MAKTQVETGRLNQDKHQLIQGCKSLLAHLETSIVKALSKLEPNSLERLAESQETDPKKSYLISIDHPTKSSKILTVDCMLLKENYIAIFPNEDRELVKKIDRLIKIKLCLEAPKDTLDLVNDLKGLVGCETAKKEIFYNQSQSSTHTDNFKSPENHLVNLLEKFITEASLLNLKKSKNNNM